MYTLDYFIKKFEAIPENKIIANDWGSTFDPEAHCTNGHCGVNRGNCNIYIEEAGALNKLFDNLEVTSKKTGKSIIPHDDRNYFIKTVNINDGDTNEYQQPTPKQRILAALYDIKKMQQPSYPNIASSIAKQFKESPESVDIKQEKVFS